MFEVDQENVTMNIEWFQGFRKIAAEILYNIDEYQIDPNISEYHLNCKISRVHSPADSSRGSDEREIAAVDRCAVLYDLLASEVELDSLGLRWPKNENILSYA